MKTRKILSLLLAVMMTLGTFTVGMTVSAADLAYSDVTEDMWAYDDIKYVTENGLMNGTGGSSFSPAVPLTRAMVVTVLYRMEGSPRVEFKSLFLDVEPRLYYSEAVIWAKNNGIVTATSVTDWGEEYFSPDREITRQELATMFVRFANFKHIITENEATLDKFTDASSVAEWASDAMKWATSCGLINGTGSGNTLSPTGKATREQFAAIIHRFDDQIEFDYELVYAEPQVMSTYTEQPYALVDDADVYVAVDGNDSNPGTIDKPLATFDAARLKVRELKKSATDEITVAFKAGNYGVLDNVTFTEEDSGSETVPVKYCKYGDGEVVFQNGIVIKHDEFTLIDDSDTNPFPEAARPYIYKADLTGIVEKFEFTTRLFTEEGPAQEARQPNGSYYTNMTTTEDPFASIRLQIALPGIVEGFRTVEGMKVSGYLRAGFIYDCFPVKSYDAETDVLTFDFENYTFPESSWRFEDGFPLMYEGRTDDLIFFSNLPEFIDRIGEYWFDNSTSTLYVYTPNGDYFIDRGDTYFTLEEGAEHISIVGFELNGTSSSAIMLYADHFTLDLCKIGNVGGAAAVNMPYDVTNLTVKNSEFYNCVDHCIIYYSTKWIDDNTFTDNKRYLISGNNVITNNYFHDFTLPEYFGSAIKISGDVGIEITHNYFFEGAHGGIFIHRCIDSVIEYNVFDEMMTKTQDFGAVYMAYAVTYRDNHIRYNIFKNNPIYAIYLDESSAGQYVYGNVFYNNGIAVVQNGARDNHIYDNVFIDCNTCITYSKGYSTENFENTDIYLWYTTSKPQPGEGGYDLWLERWPELYSTSFDPADKGKLDCIFTPVTHASGNAGFGVPLIGFEPDHKGVDDTNKNYTTKENPLFVNPSVGDYNIRDDADFAKIPYEMIGRY